MGDYIRGGPKSTLFNQRLRLGPLEPIYRPRLHEPLTSPHTLDPQCLSASTPVQEPVPQCKNKDASLVHEVVAHYERPN